MSAPGTGGGVTLGAVASGPGGIIPGIIHGPVGGGASQFNPLINSSRAFRATSF